MYDIFYISDIPSGITQLRKRFPLAKSAKTIKEAQAKCFTKFFWVIWNDIVIDDNFKFDYEIPEWDQQYIHIFKNGDTFDGVCLIPKLAEISNREMEYRFFLNKKEIDIIASIPKLYDQFVIDTYDEYLFALENTTTEMFWMTSRNIEPTSNFKFDLYFSHDNIYDRTHNHAFIHQVGDRQLYNGIFLLSKNVPITQREIEFRFPVDRKEWDIVASGPRVYDKFCIDTYDDYLYAKEHSKTELFWLIPTEVTPLESFKFDIYFTHDDFYNRTMHHVFKNQFGKSESYAGIMLCCKKYELSKREIDFRFLINKKEHDEIASTTKYYDIIFISYNEPNADKNYELLKERFPNVKRIHGVTGIHQAHIEAAKISNTHMFWVVDGDAIISDDFTFDFLTTRYERDIVYTWQSKNPVNDLIYGYGGVKLLPKQLTLEMNINSLDMTTAISNRFKSVPQVSNITSFNTDPFNTWKSAFRECVKLASKTIQGQIDNETEERLNVWCNIATGDFAIHALRGARAGRLYGKENAGNLPALSKINDFNWLEQQFKLTSVLR